MILKFILILSALFMVWICARKKLANVHFQKYMKEGQVCKYYKDLDNDLWIIEYLDGNRALIWNPYTEKFKVVLKSELFI